jgi:hypothetical protein
VGVKALLVERLNSFMDGRSSGERRSYLDAVSTAATLLVVEGGVTTGFWRRGGEDVSSGIVGVDDANRTEVEREEEDGGVVVGVLGEAPLGGGRLKLRLSASAALRALSLGVVAVVVVVSWEDDSPTDKAVVAP